MYYLIFTNVKGVNLAQIFGLFICLWLVGSFQSMLQQFQIVANNPVLHDRTKHIEIDRFFIKEKLDSGILKLSHASTEDQVADCLTKGFGPVRLSRLCDKMGLVDIFRLSRGGVLRMASPTATYPNSQILAFKRNLPLM